MMERKSSCAAFSPPPRPQSVKSPACPETSSLLSTGTTHSSWSECIAKMSDKKRELDDPFAGIPDAKRAKLDETLAEILKKHTDIDDEGVVKIIKSNNLKGYNKLLYQIMLSTTNKATKFWRRVVVYGGMTINNFQRLLDLIIKFENSSNECKFTSHDGKEVKLRGILTPAKATICEVAGLPGNKFSLVYRDYTFKLEVQKVALSKSKPGADSFVPRCTAGGGTLATCKADLKPGATVKIAEPFDVKHPNRHIVTTRFSANTSKNQVPRELPKLLMHVSSSDADYWNVVDTQMSIELD
eukprot:TRINITY_DN5272_c0_g1_i2.p1 TRINITY_DN5272_c0_g1~~TRINITY_DN5272_c0_g1_i2.p1  ORF type:complete len:298 (-),score=61.05 TRINITY_DN5272_c0_g1_i2:3-896(-)